MINLVQYQCRKAKTISSSLKKCNILQLNNTVFIQFVCKKYLYIIYTQIFIQYLYTLYTKIFIHYLYTKSFNAIYTLFIHYLYKNIYTNIFIQIYLYLNRSSSQILKNFAHFLPQLIGRHNELPSFFTN